MGGGESGIGIASEQVSRCFDCTNHGEWANPSVHEGFAETASPDWEVNKDFDSIIISRGNSTYVVVSLLVLSCDL